MSRWGLNSEGLGSQKTSIQAGIWEEDDSSDELLLGAAPLASTLVDLQLEGEARKAVEAQRAHFFTWCSLKVFSLM